MTSINLSRLALVSLLWSAYPIASATAEPNWSSIDQKLAERVENFRSETGVPAFSAVVFNADGQSKVAVSGVRRADAQTSATSSDLWHIGSISKSFTTTLIARLIEAGQDYEPTGGGPARPLSWDATLEELVAGAQGTPYAKMTLRQVVAHRAGLWPNPDGSVTQLRDGEMSLPEQRQRAVASVLAKQPPHEPGSKMLYANNGYVMAGAILEQLTGQSYETLVVRHVGGPLGIDIGFGPPGAANPRSPNPVAPDEDSEPDQPRGHRGISNESLTPQVGRFADNPALFGPAGTLHMSLADLATYGRAHLAGHLGSVVTDRPFLTTDTFRTLHEPVGDNYGAGWVTLQNPNLMDGAAVIWHNGSNTLWYAFLGFAPEKGVGVAVATNAGIHNAQKVERFALETLALLAEELTNPPSGDEP